MISVVFLFPPSWDYCGIMIYTMLYKKTASCSLSIVKYLKKIDL